MTVTDFIGARLDEDEDWARGYQAARDEFHGDAGGLRLFVRRWLPRGFGKRFDDPWPLPGEPERVLREVAAHRQILNAHASLRDAPATEYWRGRRLEVDWMLRIIAGVWSDHPDYQQDWVCEVGVR